MTCPVCGGNTKVCKTRSEDDSVRRLRWCRKCHHKFITIEIDEDLYKRITKERKTNEIKKRSV